VTARVPFSTRESSSAAAGAALDVALRQSPLAAIGFDDFAVFTRGFSFGML